MLICLLQSKVDELNPANNQPATPPQHCLRDNFFNEENITRDGGAPNDQIIAGLIRQPAQDFDRFLVEDVTNFLTNGFNAPPSDLMARNVARGRDHGLPGKRNSLEGGELVNFRNACTNILK